MRPNKNHQGYFRSPRFYWWEVFVLSLIPLLPLWASLAPWFEFIVVLDCLCIIVLLRILLGLGCLLIDEYRDLR